MFRRIAVVNRGEPAVRLIRAVRELDEELGTGICVVALHTAAEADALYVRRSDEAVALGTGPSGGTPWLDLDALTEALRRAEADAAWVGWGFVSERPAFAARCAELGVTFVGPPPDAMRRLADKIGAKQLAEEAGVPVAPWSGGPVPDVATAEEHGRRVGYPLVVKATAGGGGRGIRVVRSPGDLAAAFASARAEAALAFGDDTVFLERLVEGARHVEVQVAVDDDGHGWALGVRDCSVQRRRQKVLEESASTALDPATEVELKEAALRLAVAAGYRNLGTVEFLHQPADGTTAFLEVNTRLQVEHPVTEVTTGVDLVKLQLRLASGERLEGEPPPPNGHAIEVRLNAEDPQRGFAPAPGAVEHMVLPDGPGIRADCGVAAGDTIPAEYDSMIAKIIAWGRDRDEARARLVRAVADTEVVITGGTTNKAFLLELLRRPEVVEGRATTGWLDELGHEAAPASAVHADVALAVAAVDAAEAELAAERTRFFAAAARGRPRTDHVPGRRVELRLAGEVYGVAVAVLEPGTYRLQAQDEDRSIEVVVARLRPFEHHVVVDGRRHRVTSVVHGGEHLVEVDGVAHRVSRNEGGKVRAPAPGLVVAVPVQVGDVVPAGAAIAVVESMKMETAVVAPVAGRVRDVLVAPNVHVEAGAVLVLLEAEPEDADAPGGRRAVLASSDPGPAGDARAECLAALAELRRYLLGYDIDHATAMAAAEAYGDAREDVPFAEPEVVAAELQVLEVYADLCDVSRNRRLEEAGDIESAAPREHLLTYLRSLDLDLEALPPSFGAKLRRALHHHGIEELDHSSALREAVFRTFLALERATEHVPAVLAVLEQVAWTTTSPTMRTDELRRHLDRLVLATQLRFPLVGDLARSIRFRRFDEPMIEAARRATLAGARERVAELDAGVGGDRRAAVLDALVACPQPLLGLLVERIGPPGSAPDPLLEVVVRRYYAVAGLREVAVRDVGGCHVAVGRFGPDAGRTEVVGTAGRWEELPALLDAAASVVRDGPAVLDLYLRSEESPPPGDVLAGHVEAALGGATPPAVERVAISVGGASDGTTAHLTFARHGAGFREQPLRRGLHPMIAQRLQLWRLDRFRLERLAAPPEVVLLACRAEDDTEDERFVAMAEVRDLTPARDGDGRVVGLPELEHVLARCVDSLRHAREAAPPDTRPEWNRIVLYVWPTVETPLEELQPVIRNLVPMTEGVGLEQVLVHGRLAQPSGADVDAVLRFTYQPGAGVTQRLTDPPEEPLRPLDAPTRAVLRARRRGMVHPAEVVPLLASAPGGPAGTFVEHDLDDRGALVPVPAGRPVGAGVAGVVVGVVTTPTTAHPEGMRRVAILGDPTKSLGALAEPECRRVLAALELAARLEAPVEWFALSSGAKVSMASGTENMDWIARALRGIVEHTQAGGEINVVVAGINVGAQPYWNAEATMLMHTRGILVMTPDSAMVLTGKEALDWSGGVSAEDNLGIGGYDRIMGPNGQAQHWAPDLAGACRILFRHYEHSYVAPGERFPRRTPTTDPPDRDVTVAPLASGGEMQTVGDVLSDRTNPGRKKPFDIRSVLRAVADTDCDPLERWAEWRDAETAVVVDARLAGIPLTMVGIESRPLPRRGWVAGDGPEQWTAGTLFPLSAKKVARALNAASGVRPVAVLANLSGFDGSPESLRSLQLEFGAEIGRAVVNFDGPLVFCVLSRYHGGAFVVFSGALNDGMEVLAVEGSHASVIGGAPAAAVVFAGEVARRTAADRRLVELRATVDGAVEEEQVRLAAELAERTAAVRAEVIGALADEFDAVHTVERALAVGSVHRIISARDLRPALVSALERHL